MRSRVYEKPNWPGFLRSVRETGQIYRNTVVGGRTESGIRYYLGNPSVDTIRIHASESHPLSISFVHGNDDDHQPQTSMASITAPIDLVIPADFDETKYGGLVHGTLIWIVAWQDSVTGAVTFDLVPDLWYSTNIYMKDNVVWNKASGTDTACRMVQVGTCFAVFNEETSKWAVDALSYVPSQNDTVKAIGMMNPYTGGGLESDAWILGVSSEGGWHRIDRDGGNITVAGTIDTVNGCHTGLNDSPIFRDIQTVAVTSAHGTQMLVKIPEFYYKREGTGLAGSPYKLWVADKEAEGFKKHPAFALKDHFHVGAYACGGNYYDSIAGIAPKVSITFPTAQAAIPNNHGAGWEMWNIYQLAAIQMLFLVEFGNPDAQTLIGAGRSSGTSAVANGASNAVYRGIHEFWGNVWQMVDGFRGRTGSTEAEIWNPDGSKAYVATGLSPAAGGATAITSMVTNKGTGFDLSDVNIYGQTGTAPFADNYWGPASGFVAYHGGSWAGGASCGVFTVTLAAAASSSDTSGGCRLAKV